MMDEITETQKENRNEDGFDLAFKTLMHRTDILSKLVVEWIPELKGKEDDYVRRCLSPDGTNIVRGRETELRNVHNGMVNADCIFDITFPSDEGRIGLILGIEGQSKGNPGYPIVNRAMTYASFMLSDQIGKDYRNQRYGDAKKVYAVWIMLHPKAEFRNKVFRYKMQGVCEWPLNCQVELPAIDLMDLIFVNIGDSGSEAPNDMLGILNTIFTTDLRRQERDELLRETYKLALDDELSRDLETIRMSMGSELREVLAEEWKQEFMEKAEQELTERVKQEWLQSGEITTREQIIESLVNIIRINQAKGLSLDVCMGFVPSEYTDEVLERLGKE